MDDHEQDMHLECDSDDCASGKRNRYYAGKRLRPVSFEVEQQYLVERRRLLNRAMHGWGVVYGFDLRYQPAPKVDSNAQDPNAAKRPKHATITIGEGLALDRAGRELVQVGARPVRARDLYISKDDCEWLRTNQATATQHSPTPNQHGGADARPPEPCWLLSVHYAERQEGPVRVKDDCSCDRAEWDYLCETVRYSLQRVEAGRCHADHSCELDCRCTAEQLCESRADPLGRGSHECMSRHLRRLDPDAEQIAMTEDGGQLRFDLANGIALAEVSLRWNECGAPEFTGVLDDWGPRRLVKRNDLLFDLIRGCDLVRISDISWRDWHRSVSRIEWKDFAPYFVADTGKEFTVTFSGPVQSASVRADCFAISVVTSESSGWGDLHRVPIADVRLAEATQGDPPASTRSATLVFRKEWTVGELANDKIYSLFSHGSSLVEIEVRTGFILDMWGQAVDGSPIGARAAPTGNGSPGGRYLSTFRVKSRPRPDGDI